jgi:hypothetical protein
MTVGDLSSSQVYLLELSSMSLFALEHLLISHSFLHIQTLIYGVEVHLPGYLSRLTKKPSNPPRSFGRLFVLDVGLLPLPLPEDLFLGDRLGRGSRS